MRRAVISAAIVAVILVALAALLIIARGFRASSTPGAFETSAARLLRDFAIPRAEKSRKNPLAGDDQALDQGRNEFLARCATCHGSDGRGATPIGANVYPRVPDLHGPATQDLTDGEIRYIIANGVQLTGMPALPALERAGGARQLGACGISPKPPLEDARRGRTSAVDPKHCAVRGLPGLRALPRLDLRALEEHADGQRGARSARTS